MNLIANVADRLLGVIVPRATAAALVCPPGCHRKTCYCKTTSKGAFWYDSCVDDTDHACIGCTKTVWTC